MQPPSSCGAPIHPGFFTPSRNGPNEDLHGTDEHVTTTIYYANQASAPTAFCNAYAFPGSLGSTPPSFPVPRCMPGAVPQAFHQHNKRYTGPSQVSYGQHQGPRGAPRSRNQWRKNRMTPRPLHGEHPPPMDNHIHTETEPIDPPSAPCVIQYIGQPTYVDVPAVTQLPRDQNIMEFPSDETCHPLVVRLPSQSTPQDEALVTLETNMECNPALSSEITPHPSHFLGQPSLLTNKINQYRGCPQ